MKNMNIIPGGILVIALLCSVGTVAALDGASTGVQGTGDISDDIAAYNGPIGADSPLHGLKLAMEDLDETFTFNDTQRVEKRLDHAQLRIAEVRRELELNRTTTAERTLELYGQKLNMTEGSLSRFGSNASGLLHAQEMIIRHQAVLANLMLLYPDAPGLIRAYDNSLFLEQKFGEKTEMRFARYLEKNNKTAFKAVKREISKQDRSRNDNSMAGGTVVQERDTIQEKIKDQKGVIQAPQTGFLNNTSSIMKNPPEDKGTPKDKGKNGHN